MNDKYLIDRHKLIWHLDRVLEWQKNNLVCPIYMEVSPVSYCNHKCIFCGVDFARSNEKLDTENYVKFIHEMGMEGLKSVMFAGEGEPLLHPNIDVLIDETYNSGIDVALVTNGNNAYKKIMRKILDKLTWIRFSVDAGSDNIYSKVHGVKKGTFQKIVENIKDCIKIKKENNLNTTIGVQYLIINENFNDIENALKIFSELDIDYFSLKPFSLHPQMKNKLQVNYSKEKIEELENLTDRYAAKLNIIFRKSSLDKYIDYQKNYTHCYALPFWGHLTAKGDFYTCSVFIGDNRFIVGNINIDIDTVKELIYGKSRKESILFGAID